MGAGCGTSVRQWPAGCSFNQATGVLTCSVVSQTTVTDGPFTTTDFVPPSTLFGDFTGTQICDFRSGASSWIGTSLDDVTITGVVTTTTTTQRHGLHGKVFATSSFTSSSITNLTYSVVGCRF